MDNYLKYFIGIVVLLFLICLFFPSMILPVYEYSWDNTAKVGDTFNVLNTFFSALAFAGIIVTILIQRKELQHQRNELTLQRQEMKQTREEFLTNRITSVIYNQLERYESLVNSFTIKYGDPERRQWEKEGSNAISHLYEALKKDEAKFTNITSNDYESILENKDYDKLPEIYKIVINNRQSFINFAIPARNIVEVVKESLIYSDLNQEELNQLRNLFFRNIGYDQPHTFNGIVLFMKEAKGSLEKLGAEELINEVDEIIHCLGSISAFSILKFDPENKEKLKKNLRMI